MPNLLRNGDLQSVNWFTRPDGNQEPEHWRLEFTPNGGEMYWPEKGGWENGQRVTFSAIAGKQPEVVYKGFVPDASKQNYRWTLPEDPNDPNDETDGGSNSLLIGRDDNGQLPKRCLKVFHGPSSIALWQTVPGLTPGRKVRLTAAIVVKVKSVPTGPDGKLEDDHYRLRVALGDGISVGERVVQFSDRPIINAPIQWMFELSGTVQSNGTITVAANTQQNWPDDPDGPSFYFNSFILEYVDAAPTPTPEPAPTPTPTPQRGTVNAAQAAIEQLRLDLEAMSNALSAHEQNIRVDIANAKDMLEKLEDEFDV